MSEIIICGLSPSRKEVPRDTDAVIYGLPWDQLSHRYDLLFEMHDRSLWERRGERYVKDLQDLDCQIVMQREWADIPMSMAWDDYIEYGGDVVSKADYYNSSIAYMLVAAIQERPDKISIYGVDNHTDEEWAYERPCNEFWIGMAMGLGIDVAIHRDSSLLKFSPDVMFLDERQHYAKRYGYLAGVEEEPGSAGEYGTGERRVSTG